MTQSENTLVTVNINGRDVQVPKGSNAIEAARLIDTDIPHFCYHPKLSVVGNCRMCLIEIGNPAIDRETRAPVMDPDTGKQKIAWIPKPQIGCATNVTEGLHIRTNSQLVKDCREGVMEFLLINHPLDCPICDQAGECKLQEQATQYGRGCSRFVEKKNVKPKRTQIGPRIMLDDERCILCSRCIRFCNEVIKDPVLGFTERGSYSTLTTHPDRKFDSNYSLNTVDICPVGALTSTDFRFKMRVWFLKQTPSICTESSTGVNTTVWSREGVIYRITPRENNDVNQCWMPDSGRMLYKQVNDSNRISSIRNGLSSGKLIEDAAQLIKSASEKSSLAIVASTHGSVEEQFLLKQIANKTNAPVHIPAHKGEDDGFLISSDRAPNTAGAILTGLTDSSPADTLAQLSADIENGRVSTLLIHKEDITRFGLSAEQLAKVSIIHLGTHSNATSEAATVQIPTHTVFEKDGSFINKDQRLQKFERAIPGPAETVNDLVVLSGILRQLDETQPLVRNAAECWPLLSAAIPSLNAIPSRQAIPANGIQIQA